METDDSTWGNFLSEVMECLAGQVSERRLVSMQALVFPDQPPSTSHRAMIVNFLLNELPLTMWEQPGAREALRNSPVTLQVQ